MKALIVDDEPMAAKLLRNLIKRYCSEIATIQIISSPIEALSHLSETTYDLLFLDVEMPEINGIQLLESANLPTTTQVVFTTSYSNYAIDAFQVNATHYMLKPVEKNDLIAAVQKVIQMRKLDSAPKLEPNDLKVLSIYHNDEYHILQIADIIRLEADGSYTKIILVKGSYYSSKGVGHFEKKMHLAGFFRCHNSHLINTKKVIRIRKGKSSYAILSNSDSVPISSGKKEAFEKMMGL